MDSATTQNKDTFIAQHGATDLNNKDSLPRSQPPAPAIDADELEAISGRSIALVEVLSSYYQTPVEHRVCKLPDSMIVNFLWQLTGNLDRIQQMAQTPSQCIAIALFPEGKTDNPTKLDPDRQVDISIARNHWRSILTGYGMELPKDPGQPGPCPVCKSAESFSFEDKDGHGTWNCSSCGTGNGMELLVKVTSWRHSEALELITEWLGIEKTEVSGSNSGVKQEVKPDIESRNTGCKHSSPFDEI